MLDAPPGPSPRAVARLDEAAAAMRDLRAARSRLHTAVHGLEVDAVAEETGHRCTRRLIEEHLRLDSGDARRLLRHAAATTPDVAIHGGPTPPQWPATAEALADGDLGEDHLVVIDRTMRAVDRLDHVDAATRSVTEEQLAALARDRSPGALADAAREVLAILDPDGAAPTDRDLPDNELHTLRRSDGSLVGRFRYADPAAAEIIAAALAAATPPADADGDGPGGGDIDDPGGRPLRTHAERQAQGFADLAAEALIRGVDHDENDRADDAEGDADGGAVGTGDDLSGAHEPDSGGAFWARPATEGGERIHVAVTVDWELLRGSAVRGTLPGLGRLGSGCAVGPETARRLACDAGILPVTLGSRSQPLDIGRRSRIIPAAMRAALILRDRRCAHPGCRRRARRCAGHHIVHWAHWGETALENLVLLCPFHHAVIHHGGWSVRMIDGLPWFYPPAWIDPLRRPRHNRTWLVEPTAGLPA